MKKRILFIGDSITESGRDYSDESSLGTGYVKILYDEFLKYNYIVLNKGIGGNKILDLKNRIEKECISFKPDIVSIMIGINDVWHCMNSGSYDIDIEMKRFENIYRDMLSSLRNLNIENIILIEPFVLSYPEDRKFWLNDLDRRRCIIKNLADEYNCLFVSVHNKINEVSLINGVKKYSEDGVHPTIYGHTVIANQLLPVIKNM